MKVNSYNDYVFPNKYHYSKDIPAERGQKGEQDTEPEVGKVYFLIKDPDSARKAGREKAIDESS